MPDLGQEAVLAHDGDDHADTDSNVNFLRSLIVNRDKKRVKNRKEEEMLKKIEAEARAMAQSKEEEGNKNKSSYNRKKQVTTLFPTEEEKKRARVIKTPVDGGNSVVLNILGRTTDHNGRVIEINKPIVKNSYEMPEILVKKCPINVLEIVDGELIKGTLSVKDRSQ